MNPQLHYLLALHRAINLTFPRFKILQKHFDNNWEKVFQASEKEIQSLPLDIHAKNKWANTKKTCPQKEQDLFENSKAHATLYGDANYPASLLTISSPPVLLFYKGNSLHHGQNLAIIGSRKISSYSQNILEKIIPPLVQNNFQIISGLALGVDKQAHVQTLKAKGKTLAVLGCGIDTVYPSTHTRLAEEIVEKGGTLVSEFLPQTQARPENFPIRNRIIAGLSRGVIVIQANQKSGSIITAHQALEQGKEVMTFPGSIFSPGCQGCHQLIKKGESALVESVEDIFECLNVTPSHIKLFPEKLSEEESKLLQLFQTQKIWTYEDLLKESGKDRSTLTSLLTKLEMKHQVHRTEIGEYQSSL